MLSFTLPHSGGVLGTALYRAYIGVMHIVIPLFWVVEWSVVVPLIGYQVLLIAAE